MVLDRSDQPSACMLQAKKAAVVQLNAGAPLTPATQLLLYDHSSRAATSLVSVTVLLPQVFHCRAAAGTQAPPGSIQHSSTQQQPSLDRQQRQQQLRCALRTPAQRQLHRPRLQQVRRAAAAADCQHGRRSAQGGRRVSTDGRSRQAAGDVLLCWWFILCWGRAHPEQQPRWPATAGLAAG